MTMPPEYQREMSRSYLRSCVVFVVCVVFHLIAAYAAWRTDNGRASLAAHLVTAGAMGVMAGLQWKLRRIWVLAQSSAR